MNAGNSELINSLVTLNHIAETLNSAQDVHAVLPDVLADLVQWMELETGWIFLRDTAEGLDQQSAATFSLVASYNLPAALAPHQTAVWSDLCECQLLCRQGALNRATNQVTCSRLAELSHPQRHGLTMHASAPMRSGQQVMGILNVAARDWHEFTPEALALLGSAGNLIGIALERARLYRLLYQQHRDELSVARTIQLSMLPKQLPQPAGWQVAACYQAADMVGGDFYDFFTLPGNPPRQGLLIGDVADKGVPAALFMALSRTLLRSTALSGRGPAAALLRANHLILNDSQSDLFLSAFYAVLEPTTGRLVFANAGHNRPLWWQARRGRVQTLRARGTVLGAFEDIHIEERRLTVQPGDALLFYTDGLSEARDAQGRMLGTDALMQLLKQHGHSSAQALSSALQTAYSHHAAGNEQQDDLSFFVVKRLPEA